MLRKALHLVLKPGRKKGTLLEKIIKKKGRGYCCDFRRRERKGLQRIFFKLGSLGTCIKVDRKNSVIIIVNTYFVGHMQDDVLNALHIFTHLIFLISLGG